MSCKEKLKTAMAAKCKRHLVKKRLLGLFFTASKTWLLPQVEDFIKATKNAVAYDPFAGIGSMLSTAKSCIDTITSVKGLDIDAQFGWQVNDSLVNIPHVNNAVIITNPPYLANYAASRKKIIKHLKKYFSTTKYNDLYLLALDKMLAALHNVVAIVPETFINSSYSLKQKLYSLSILEKSPFLDTSVPVIVACFDSIDKNFNDIKVYKDSTYVATLQEIEDARLVPDRSVKTKFNDPNGWLAVRCIDTTSPEDMIRFAFKDGIRYDWKSKVKVSSRLLTLVSVDVPVGRRRNFIDACNKILADMRKISHDIVLSPFKDNMKNDIRRRRLDFMTCRAIIENAYKTTIQKERKT